MIMAILTILTVRFQAMLQSKKFEFHLIIHQKPLKKRDHLIIIANVL
jgi:hypothetical protein